MNASELLNIASNRTGLTDFGPDDFRDGFTVLIDAINGEAEIRGSCQKRLEERFINLLIQRLWFAKDMKEHPEIGRERIASPLIIISLPRTGSTKLHRMLGATGDFQTLRFWGTMKFARIPGMEDGGLAQRIRETKAHEEWMYEQSPAILVGHPSHAEEPEEDVYLMEATFRHPALFGMYDAPSFAHWVEHADPQPAYDYLFSVIKYLQWQDAGPSRPWLFKDPNHLGREQYLVDAYERPKFIVTHRDPVKCVPSVTSTVMATRRIYSDLDNRQAFASKMVDALSSAMNSHMEWRDRNPDIQILDVGFNDVVKNGEATIKKIYDFAGMDLTEGALDGIREWETENPKGKHGESKYSAQDVGSTDEAIRQAFSSYNSRFGHLF
ncbi:sulfotransferase family protein [Rhizorhapis suberifaciens]|uniref:Sulfotransferase n=1 Tax=Rhizorhapis suberifaciens TaxID=13656 RepID=A0A840HZ10_9SPHN|nr:sulfotransferase [Rhizorhapis suberifaciens]MBB4642800.1 hypothetical protein [Rhizorhapis suberifaciens]